MGLWQELGPIWLGERGLTCAILFASGVGVAVLERWLRKTIAITCFLSIALLLLLCGHRETFVLVVIAPVCVLLNDLPPPRWTAPKLDISFGVYLYALPIQHLTSGLPLSFWTKGLLAFAITPMAGTLSAQLVEQPMLRIRKRIGRVTWLDNVWPAFRVIAESDGGFCPYFIACGAIQAGRSIPEGGPFRLVPTVAIWQRRRSLSGAEPA